ncbi:MAG: aminopeptidase [Sphingobacteriales bacterium]|nr:aminopeptidase [Sphingobacteriales bacterium]
MKISNFNHLLFIISFGLTIPFSSLAQEKLEAPKIENGVTKFLADFRSEQVSEIHYQLNFNIPQDQSKAISAKETLSFYLNTTQFPLQIDFKGSANQLKSLTVNGKTESIQYQNEHLIIPASALKAGKNAIQIDFIAGDGALNRNDDYLYTLFVPDRARTCFPCFDQPNLKATFGLTLEVPGDWEVIANGILKGTILNQGRKICEFANSDIISTYLFSFTAGNFTSTTQEVDQKSAQFLYRETDSTKIKMSVDSVFQAHRNAINFLSKWTNIPFPFQKIGFIGIPDFQFGGMEHPGAVQYQASTLFLDNSATKSQFIARANLISHETAHMWFGDLVSIKWFDDVWTKEVFANFMADKVSESLKGQEEFDHKFLIDHFPAAYSIDRTIGANPIRQPLDNLNDAGSLYGNIIYHKAPIMMRQLELLMGKEKFQQGMREYLKTFSFSNASWPDLINILNKYAPVDLLAWNKVWVNDNGRPVFSDEISYDKDEISRFIITQKPEFGSPRVWPQSFKITLFYDDYSKTLTVNSSGAATDIKSALGLAKPKFIVFNAGGEGYGVWPVDLAVMNRIDEVSSPLVRASYYISAYENMLNQREVRPSKLLQFFTDQLQKEKDELNLRLLTGYIGNIFWEFNSAKRRTEIAPALENQIWEAIQQQSLANNKKNLLKLYQDVFLSNDAYQRLYQIWKSQQTPENVKFSEDDYTSLAFALQLRKDNQNILAEQFKRIKNPDRKKRFEFVSPALSADVKVRDQFFASLADLKNREKESNVLAALSYLHHPLRQETSIKYLKKSLDLLQEIQVTGDIFFPQSWLQATFGNYQNAATLKIVNDFLAAHPNYPEKLKAKILQASDQLKRAQKLEDQE